MKRIILFLSALSLVSSHSAALAQCCVSHPSIRHEEWHYSDYIGGNLTGHFIELCNGNHQNWGYPDIHSVIANGDCGE